MVQEKLQFVKANSKKYLQESLRVVSLHILKEGDQKQKKKFPNNFFSLAESFNDFYSFPMSYICNGGTDSSFGNIYKNKILEK